MYAQPIAVESGPLTSYARAEDYHQDVPGEEPRRRPPHPAEALRSGCGCTAGVGREGPWRTVEAAALQAAIPASPAGDRWRRRLREGPQPDLRRCAVLPRLVLAAADRHRAPVPGAVLGVVVEGPLAGVAAARLEARPRPSPWPGRRSRAGARARRPRRAPRPRAAPGHRRPPGAAGARARRQRPRRRLPRAVPAGRRCCRAAARAEPLARPSPAARRRGERRPPSPGARGPRASGASAARIGELVSAFLDVARVHEGPDQVQVAGRFLRLCRHRLTSGLLVSGPVHTIPPKGVY